MEFVRLFASLLPLLGGLCALWGRSGRLALAAYLLSLLAFGLSLAAAPGTLLYSWTATFPALQLGLVLDPLNAVLHVMVGLIACLVALFSRYYLHGHPWQARYWVYLGAFTTAMHGLLLSPGLFQLFIFWELMGLCSFLLISFYQSPRASQAATKAFWLNRIGDAGLLAGILGLVASGAGDAFSSLAGAPAWVPYALCMGVMAKSAQFPLQVWLPDAMAGPTTASALIHAATMVAAGVFLLARIVPWLGPEPLHFLLLLGSLTALMAALSALAQSDIKKLLAYSTISQLGFMVAAMGTGQWQVGVAHLLTHACFKAGLFLGAGVLIHELGHHPQHYPDPQNLYRMGGLARRLPWTTTCMTLCGAALAGLPLFSGGLSKEPILAVVFQAAPGPGWLLLLSALCTAAYVSKLLWLAFYRRGQGPALHEPDYRTRLPLGILAALSLWLPYSPNPLQPEMGWWPGWIGFSAPHSGFILVAALASTVLGVLLAGLLFRTRLWGPGPQAPLAGWSRGLRAGKQVLAHHFYLDTLWISLAAATIRLARGLAWLDTRLIDGLVRGSARLVAGAPGPGQHTRTLGLAGLATRLEYHLVDGAVRGLGALFLNGGNALRQLQAGRTQRYLLIS
ncbi:MAG: NADH-quinone oxidoreductase subunit L, partial [Sphingobacteriia bacterium]